MAESENRKTTRRDFFLVLPADDAKASGEQETASDRLDAYLQPENSELMMHVSRRAMASLFEVRFPAGIHERDTEIALQSLELLENLEEQLSFFRPTSEISRINLLAADAQVEVEPELFKLLCLARDIWRDTEGAMDITATPLWQAWGFARREGTVAGDAQIADALSRVGFQFVELDDQRKSVRFSRPGIRLNLGSIGKGFALDRCAAELIQGGMENFLLHGGQSSIVAHGSEKTGTCSMPHATANVEPGGKGDSPIFVDTKIGTVPDYWTIGIPHPWRAGRRVAEIRLRNRAIGTSSSQFQSFRHEGKRYGHIIDPRTGRPAEDVISATVVAPSAALADALSTAFYVLGPDKSLAYCEANPEIGAVLTTPSSRGGDLEIHSFGLDDRDFTIK